MPLISSGMIRWAEARSVILAPVSSRLCIASIVCLRSVNRAIATRSTTNVPRSARRGDGLVRHLVDERRETHA